MKVLLYFEDEQMLAKSGIGRALEHQKKALDLNGIEYTLDQESVDYDILHINTYGLKSKSMIRKARKMNKKIVYHGHSTEEDFRNSFIGSNQLAPLVKKYLISLYSQADLIITPTPYSKRLLENYGIKQPIRAISNGIDLERYEKSEAKETAFREYFAIKEGQKIIISVGLYFERKGIFDFIEVAKRFPHYRFIWFGHTPLLSIPSQIRKIIQGDHPDNVEFPGYIKGDVLEGAYSASDLFFFPSFEETEGIVVLEALASHQKVLVREIPVYEGWLTDNVNCYKGQDLEDFVRKIPEIVEGQYFDTRKNGYKVAEQRSIEQIGKELKDGYESIIQLSVRQKKNVDCFSQQEAH